jgi:5-dehydro-2-deoxygluconokinase
MSEAAAGGRPLELITIGRAAVDLYGEQIGGRLEDMGSFAKYLGGCPANIAVGTARLGIRVGMITRVGDEHMGRFVRETLAREGVDVSHVTTDPTRLTALVVLGIRDRDTFPLIFYRENCADMAIAPEDCDPAFIVGARALLVTGTHFSKPGVDRACRTAIAHARAAGTRVILDIDYRPVLWGLTGHGLGEQRFVASETVSAHLQSIAAQCDLVVGTEEEIHIAGGSTDSLTALKTLRALTRATLVMKRGPMGCAIFADAIPDRIEDGVVIEGFPVQVLNVLGAGDAFMSGFLRGWLRDEALERCGLFANACGALVVSRHSCAPAMPSWTELTDCIARAPGLERLDTDAQLNHLHRVTTRARAWLEVMALAFDHRSQFEALARHHGADAERIRRFKVLIADGAVRAAQARGLIGSGAGAIIDDRFGEAPLFHLTGAGWWLARPIELPGHTPLVFEGGADVGLTLRTWPVEHVVKCLVAYHPDDAHAAEQEKRVKLLFEACVGSGHELLLEIIPPHGGGDVVARSVTRFYDLGIRPDWWKLPAQADGAAWQRIGDILRARDPHCRGILVLGLEADEAALARSFAATAAEPLCRGFAVGRSIFNAPAEAWFAGRLDDADAIADIAAAYGRLIELWRGRTG